MEMVQQLAPGKWWSVLLLVWNLRDDWFPTMNGHTQREGCCGSFFHVAWWRLSARLVFPPTCLNASSLLANVCTNKVFINNPVYWNAFYLQLQTILIALQIAVSYRKINFQMWTEYINLLTYEAIFLNKQFEYSLWILSFTVFCPRIS